MFTGFYDPTKDFAKQEELVTTMTFELPDDDTTTANESPLDENLNKASIPESPSSSTLSFGAYLASVSIQTPVVSTFTFEIPTTDSPSYSYTPTNNFTYTPNSYEPGSFGASFYNVPSTEPKKEEPTEEIPATPAQNCVQICEAAHAHDDKTPLEIPFNLQRSNFANIFGYIEPTAQPEQTNIHTPDCPIRVSMLESGFTNNPYYHHDEYEPEDDQKVQPGSEEAKECEELACKERERINNQVFQPPQLTGFEALLAKIAATGEKYVDTDFPANDKSLYGYNYAERVNEWGDCTWLRADDFYGKDNYQIFMDKIEPDDIEQGLLGNCYFLSTISSLAEWPERIRRLFVSEKTNDVGCYSVKVCEMGEWKEVVVDDLFPCSKWKRSPIFTRGNDKELWVLILEKVWAKIYGSYDNTEAGLTRECLHDLTGAPTKFFLTDRREEWELIWSKIVKAEGKDYVMTCGAGEFWTQTGVNTQGIVASHAYSLLAAYDEVDAYGRKVRLVKVRNPWGQTEWNGAWSDTSSLWTPELKQRLQVENKDDGIFFMEYKDFLKYFDDIQICYTHDNHKYHSQRVTSDANHAVYFKVKIEQEGKYYFTVNQESKRKHSQNASYRYSTVNIVVAKILGDGKYQYVTGNSRADKEVWAKGTYTPGEYLIYAKVKWIFQNKNDFVLSSYGPGMTDIQVVNKAEYPTMIDQVFMCKGRNSQKKQTFAREGEPNAYSVVDITKDGFIYCYYNNQSSRTLETEVYFKEFRGVKLRKPFRGQSYSLKVPAGQEKIVVLKILPNQDVRQVLGEKVRFV